jgi:Tfp pilus assembly protein PilO
MTKMRQWTVMTIVAVVIVFAGGWLLLVKPQGSKISAVKTQATTQQSANQVLLQEIAAREAQKNTLPAEQAQLQKLSVQVPTVPDEPGIIRQLQSSASGAGVNLLSITPGGATPVTIAAATVTPGSTSLPAAAAGQLIELPVTMAVVGSYANVESYFQLLEKLPRAMLVTQFSLCPVKPTSGGSSSCTSVTVPPNTNVPDGALSATLSADVFFSPTTPTATVGGTATLPSTAASTAPATTTTAPTTTSSSPAATTTTPAPLATASPN